MWSGRKVSRPRRQPPGWPNVLPPTRSTGVGRQLVQQMTHFFALMLWTASGLAIVAGMPQLTVAIVVVIIVNGLFAFAQEYRADRAAKKLRLLVPRRVLVRRDGRRVTVDADEVVIGDVVLVEAGDRIPASGGRRGQQIRRACPRRVDADPRPSPRAEPADGAAT